MNIYEFKEILERKPASRFSDRQLELVGDLNASGYTFQQISEFMNCTRENLNTAYLKYRTRVNGCRSLCKGEIDCRGGGPWYHQYSLAPQKSMSAL